MHPTLQEIQQFSIMNKASDNSWEYYVKENPTIKNGKCFYDKTKSSPCSFQNAQSIQPIYVFEMFEKVYIKKTTKQPAK